MRDYKQAMKELRKRTPIICLCGEPMTGLHPTIDAKYFGYRSDPCGKCGAPAASLRTYRDDEEMAVMAATLRGLLGDK